MTSLEAGPHLTALRSRDHERLRSIINDVLLGADALSLAESLTELAETACKVIGCEYAVVLVLDEAGDPVYFLPVGVAEGTAARIGCQPTGAGLLGVVVDEGRILRVPDIAVERGYAGLPAHHPPIKELLGVPLRAAGRVTGGLFLSAHLESVPFSVDDEQAAQVIATAAGFLLDRSRAAEETERKKRWLTSSTELTRELLAGVHTDPMQVLVERVVHVADADLAVVLMPSVDGRSVVATSAAGERAEWMRHRIMEREGSVTDAVIASGKPTIVADLSASGRHSVLTNEVGVNSALLVPMSGAAAKCGTLALFRYPNRRPFTETEVEMASTFAAQMVLALELADAHADRERAALLAERERIARDLHDNVIQQLFAVGMSLQSIAGRVKGQPGERLQSAVDDLDGTIMQIRSTIYRLTGPVFSSDTMRSRVENLIAELEPMLGFTVDLEIRGPIDFGVADPVSADLMAVLRETVTNTARHAGATRLTVRLVVDDSGLTLTVADDGRGMSGATRRSGLSNLRARAIQHGGTMTLDTGNHGTTITWSVPAPAADEADR